MWGAGCTQQREEPNRALGSKSYSESNWGNATAVDIGGMAAAGTSDMGAPPKQDTLKLVYTFVVGDDHIMRQINPEPMPDPPCYRKHCPE